MPLKSFKGFATIGTSVLLVCAFAFRYHTLPTKQPEARKLGYWIWSAGKPISSKGRPQILYPDVQGARWRRKLPEADSYGAVHRIEPTEGSRVAPSEISSYIALMPAKKKIKRSSRKAKAGSKGLEVLDCRLDISDHSLSEVRTRIEGDGGIIVGTYRDPLGGNPLAIAVVPIDRIEPTPFQRDLSETHHKRLAVVIEKTGTFLDPVISVLGPKTGFWTPNGRHRLEAMRRLGAKSITTLVVPNRQLAWQILALNTEKAHNLKERSLEVARIYRGLLDDESSRPETNFGFYLEEAALVTLGFCYEKKASFAGGAYHPVLRRLEDFSDEPLRQALHEHEKRAQLVLDLEETVSAVVARLKERGLTSPYLRTFVVARINPLRWIKGDLPPLEQVLKTMQQRADKFNVEKVKPQDLASMAAVAPAED